MLFLLSRDDMFFKYLGRNRSFSCTLYGVCTSVPKRTDKRLLRILNVGGNASSMCTNVYIGTSD